MVHVNIWLVGIVDFNLRSAKNEALLFYARPTYEEVAWDVSYAPARPAGSTTSVEICTQKATESNSPFLEREKQTCSIMLESLNLNSIIRPTLNQFMAKQQVLQRTCSLCERRGVLKVKYLYVQKTSSKTSCSFVWRNHNQLKKSCNLSIIPW